MKYKSHLKITHPAVYRIFTLPSFPPWGLIHAKMPVAHFYFLSKLFLFLIVLTFQHLHHDHIWSVERKSHLKIAHPAVYIIWTLPSFLLWGLIQAKMPVAHFYYLSKLFLFLIVLTFSHLQHDHFWSVKKKNHRKITNPAVYRILTLPSFPPWGLIQAKMLVAQFYYFRTWNCCTTIVIIQL